MALRVLLADESSTIRKVMQLALQEFAVEVKSVPAGVDVLPVAKSFRPDLVFADVLLVKRSGYEVCQDLKSDPSTQKIPVVLMWSGFMELDQNKVRMSKCDGRLEKPFDADTLRSLVRDLVPRLQTNAISGFMNYPRLPEFEEPAAPAPLETAKPAPVKPSSGPVKESNAPGFASDAELDEFEMAPLPKNSPTRTTRKPEPAATTAPEQEQWATGSLSGFQIRLPNQETLPPAPDLQDAAVWVSHGGGPVTETSLADLDDLSPQRPSRVGASAQVNKLDPVHLEQLVREQVREVLQSIAWQIVPDLAERIVREEIQKLIVEAERHS